LPSIKKLGLGNSFEQEREILALIYISYFYILLFSLVGILLHTSSEELLPVTYRYHTLILLSIFIASYMMLLKDGTEKIIPIILENRYYYGFIPVILYIFVNLALGLVFARNYQYEQMDKIMGNSLEGVERVTDIVTSLKIFSNPGKAHKQDHDLNQLLYSALLSIEKKIPYYINLTKNIPDGTTIYCFDEQLQQVFNQILLNALHVLEESKGDKQKTIDISVSEIRRENQKHTCISFSNNGPPIPEHQIKFIYDPFYTIDNAGTGKGLGMAISYMIMKEHQGWIEARNENNLVIFDVIFNKA